MDAIKIYFKDIKKIPLLTAEEEVDLAKRIKKGDLEAQDKLTRSNLRLVINIAKRYMHLGMSLLDLIEEGNIGLMKAVQRFDHERGFRFSTYGAWWIKQSITRCIFDQARTIRLPVYMSELISKWRKTKEHLSQKFKRPPTTNELAKAMKIPLSKVRKIHDWMGKSSSLNAPISSEGVASIGDLVADSKAESPQDELDAFFAKERIQHLLELTNDKEKAVLNLRFGLNDGEIHTLADVAKRLKLSRERIRQIEENALTKLRNFCEKEKKITMK